MDNAQAVELQELLTADRGPEVTAVLVTFLVLVWIAVLLRCWCRIIVVRAFGADDYLSAIAVVFFTVWSACSLRDIHYGTGKHVIAIGSLERYSIGLKWWWICEPVYTISSTTLKWSICIYLLRLCVVRSQRVAIYCLMVLAGIFGWGYFFISIFQCKPVSYFWTQVLGKPGRCLSNNFIVDACYMYSAVSCFIDWSLAIIPIFLVWNLQMSYRTKLSVAGILALAAAASAATIIRMPYIHTMRDVDDFLYATTDIAIWSMVETGIGIVASSFATLRPLFRTYLSLRSKNSSDKDKNLHNSPGDPPSKPPSKNKSKKNRNSHRISQSITNASMHWPSHRYSARQGAGYIRTIEGESVENIKLEERDVITRKDMDDFGNSGGFGNVGAAGNGRAAAAAGGGGGGPGSIINPPGIAAVPSGVTTVIESNGRQYTGLGYTWLGDGRRYLREPGEWSEGPTRVSGSRGWEERNRVGELGMVERGIAERGEWVGHGVGHGVGVGVGVAVGERERETEWEREQRREREIEWELERSGRGIRTTMVVTTSAV